MQTDEVIKVYGFDPTFYNHARPNKFGEYSVAAIRVIVMHSKVIPFAEFENIRKEQYKLREALKAEQQIKRNAAYKIERAKQRTAEKEFIAEVNTCFVRKPMKKYPLARVLPSNYFTAAELIKKKMAVADVPDGYLYYVLANGGGSDFTEVYQI